MNIREQGSFEPFRLPGSKFQRTRRTPEALIVGIAEKDIIIREVKAIALESYRNGKAEAPKAKRFTARKTAVVRGTRKHAPQHATRPSGGGFCAS